MFLANLLSNRSGVSAIEFALVLPIMITLLFGSIEVTQLLSLNRKLIAATQTVADLISQDTSASIASVTDAARAAELILLPFPRDDLRMGISQVEFRQGDGAPVETSPPFNLTLRGGTIANKFGKVAGLGDPGQSVIIVEATYNYRSIFGQLFFSSVPMTETAVLRPRLGTLVERNF